MKYCIDFLQECYPILDKVDEINIKYNRKNTHILDFINEHKTQTINVCLEDKENVDTFLFNNEIMNIKSILDNNPTYKIKVRIPNKNEYRELFLNLKEHKIPVFENRYLKTWDEIYESIIDGVSDIYIINELGFDLKNIKIATKGNIEIRVFPHIAQSDSNIDDIKKFFIRPEDIELYDSVIDVCELKLAGKKANILYNIYAKDKKWYGKLNEIIANFNSDLDSRYIVPAFGQQRIKCEKKCFKGGKCTLCERVNTLSKILEKNNLLIKVDKEEEDGKRTDN